MNAARLVVRGLGAVDAPAGTSLLEACESGGFPMGSDCGGFAACNACRVVVHRGAEHLSTLAEEEDPFLDRAEHRLGCQARLLGGEVEVSLDPG